VMRAVDDVRMGRCPNSGREHSPLHPLIIYI
jgi:hypothetical protein